MNHGNDDVRYIPKLNLGFSVINNSEMCYQDIFLTGLFYEQALRHKNNKIMHLHYLFKTQETNISWTRRLLQNIQRIHESNQSNIS